MASMAGLRGSVLPSSSVTGQFRRPAKTSAGCRAKRSVSLLVAIFSGLGSSVIQVLSDPIPHQSSPSCVPQNYQCWYSTTTVCSDSGEGLCKPCENHAPHAKMLLRQAQRWVMGCSGHVTLWQKIWTSVGKWYAVYKTMGIHQIA
jgi:hypothetical protein